MTRSRGGGSGGGGGWWWGGGYLPIYGVYGYTTRIAHLFISESMNGPVFSVIGI